jgi:hypothetical protein
MRLSWRDSIATVLVAIGVLVYLAWLVGFEIPGLTEPARVSIAMLVLGVAASASAVVPGFADLLRGSKLYLASASALGLIAVGAGVCTIFGADPFVGLAVLAITMVMMWVMATMRHVGVGSRQHHLQGPVASAR